MANSKSNPDAPELKLVGSRPKRKSTGGDGRTSTTPSPYCAGDVISSKYRLTSILGEGGMGEVWLARNIALDVDVAVKLIRREMATPEATARLLQEARATARLEHPSIVRVYDFGETEKKDPFIVMEVLRGEDLIEVLERKVRMSPVASVRTLLPVMSGLVAAHEKGIVHRDLKPDNIFLLTEARGRVQPKIVDFGIAKLRIDPVENTSLTLSGTIVGSPDYMSPEQSRGQDDVDERADIWSLCVVFYELLTGRKPFMGANYNDLLSTILLDDPEPISQYDIDEPELWGILEKGLQKDPADRWPSVRVMGRELANWGVAHDFDTDVAGKSIAEEWLTDTVHPPRPLSDAPPSAMRRSLADERERAQKKPASPPPPAVPPLREVDVFAAGEPEVPVRSLPIKKIAIGGGIALAVFLGLIVLVSGGDETETATDAEATPTKAGADTASEPAAEPTSAPTTADDAATAAPTASAVPSAKTPVLQGPAKAWKPPPPPPKRKFKDPYQ